MKPKHKFLPVFLTVTMAASLPAVAADLYWDGTDSTADADGGSGTWDTSATNWDDAPTGGANAAWNNSNLDTAFFGGAAGTVTLNTGITANGLTFNTGGYIITGNTLTLGGATPTVTANFDATIASILAFGANTFSTAGTGTLTLSGANTGTGPINVTQGTLKLGAATALGSSSLTTVSSGATLDLSGFSASGRAVNIAGTGVGGLGALRNSSTTTGAGVGSTTLSSNATISSAVPGADTSKMVGLGTLTLNSNKLTVSSGAFSLGIRDITSGDIDINNGATLYIQNAGSQTSATGTITINTGGRIDTRDTNNTAMSSVHTIALNGGILGRGQITGNNGGGAGTILKNNITVDAVNGGSILNSSSGGFGLFYRLTGALSGTGALTLGGGVGVEFQGDTSGYTGTATGTGGTISFNTTGTQVFNGILAGTRPVQKVGSGTTTFAGANTYTGATTVSTGTLVLSGANTGNTAVTVASGATLRLDYDTQNNSKLHDSSVLTLSGGTVDLNGATGSHTEVVGSTTLTAGTANTITRTGGNTAVLNLNTITRNTGATLNFGASGIARTDNLNNSSGILGTWATIGGGEFAVNSTNSADGLITAPSYDLTSVALDSAANYTDRHMSVDSNQSPDGAITPYTLTFNNAGAYTLNLTGTNTIKGGGIAVASAVGNNASTLGGGILQAGTAGGDLFVNQANTANILTIGSVIQNNTSASTLTKSGAGTLVLSGVSTFTGQTNILGGTLRFGVANALATSGAVMSAGSLDLAGFNQSLVGLRSDGATAPVVTNSDPGTATNTLSITGGWFGNYSGAIQNGATAKTAVVVSGTNGRISWAGTNTFTGGLAINGNGVANGADTGVILGINGDAALGAASNVITLNNGGALFNATSTTAGWTASTTPTLAAGRSIVMGSGVGGVFRVWGGTTFTVNSVISGSGDLTKTDGGILLLGAANTYTGNTSVREGTVRVGNKNAFGPFVTGRPVTQVTVASGATVDFNAIADATYGYTIAGTGVGNVGALTNSSATAISNGSAQASNIRLSANASIGGTGNWSLLTNSYNATSLDLGGFTLTKSGANTIALVSTTTTAGTIQVSAGTLAFGVTNGGSGVTGAASALTLDNISGVSLSVVRDSSIGSLAGGGSTGGGVNLNPGTARTLTVGALNANTSYAGVISGTGGVITKVGTGTQTLTGANTYTGATNINRGTLLLDFATNNTGVLASTSALTLGGGTLSLRGRTGAFTTTQTLASLTLTAGTTSSIVLNPNGGTSTVLTITNNTPTTGAGSLVNFNYTAGTTNGSTLGNNYVAWNPTLTGGIIGGSYTVTDSGGFGYATVSGGKVLRYVDTGSAGLPQTTGASTGNYFVGSTYSTSNTALDGSLVEALSGSVAANTVTVDTTGLATGANLALAANTLTLTGGGGMIFNGANPYAITATGAGGITSTSAGALIFHNYNSNTVTISAPIRSNGVNNVTFNGSGTTVLSGAGTWTGSTAINGGTLEVQAKSGDVPYIVASGATLRIGYTTGGNYANTNLKLTGDGVSATTGLYLRGGTSYNASGQIELLAAPTTIRHYGTGLAAIGMFDINGDAINVSAAASGSVIDSNIEFVSRGFGMSMTVASGSNTTTGDLIMNGRLNVGSLGFYKRGAGSLLLNQAATTANTAVKIQGGSVIAGAADVLGSNADLPISSGASLRINGFDQAARNLSGAGRVVNGSTTASTLTISSTTATTFSGVLGGTGTDENNFGFTKTGSSALTLSGTNTYTGSTILNGGTLEISGNSSAVTGAVSVSAGTLLVSGQLGGNVTVDATAIIGGTGTLGGNLTFDSASYFRIVDINDALQVTGTITFGSGFGIENLLGLNWDDLTLNTPYTIISTTQTFTDTDIFNFGAANAVDVGTGRQAYFQNGSLQVVVIPEPSAALLGGLGFLLLLRRRRA